MFAAVNCAVQHRRADAGQKPGLEDGEHGGDRGPTNIAASLITANADQRVGNASALDACKRAPPARHFGVMSDTVVEKRAAKTKADEWAERIAAQQHSGVSVQFCKEK